MGEQSIDRAVREAMRAGQVPGIVAAVARGADPAEFHVVGEDARGQPLAADSLFPVASITKLATALVAIPPACRSTSPRCTRPMPRG